MSAFLRSLCLSAILFVAVISCELVDVRRPESPEPEVMPDPLEGVEHSTVGYTISAFQINPCLLTKGERQYVAYYDSLHRMTVASRMLPDGEWRHHALDEWTGWDGHNYIVMALDVNGVLHLAGNMHDSPLVYFRSDVSGDMESLARSHMTGDLEDRVTYPAFMYDAEGRLIFHYRYGCSGDGQEIFNVLGEDGVWKRLIDKPLLDGQGMESAYLSGPLYGPDGYFHLVWMWRSEPDCCTNHDLYYVRSRDLVHWENAAGEEVEIPMLPYNGKLLIDAVPMYSGLLNIAVSVGFDADGQVLVFYHKYDSVYDSQLYLARPSEDGWQVVQQTGWKGWRWDFSGYGSIVRELELDCPRVGADGNISLVYHRIDKATGSMSHGEIVSLTQTLGPVIDRIAEATFPGTFYESKLPYGRVYILQDSGDGGYILRWEALQDNRDIMPSGILPPASELNVISLR